MSERKTIAVIDGNSLMHRAFHAISANMTSPSGEPTNAVFGFVSMLVKLVDSYAPWGIVCCFDKGKPEGRLALLPSYKAKRPPMDPALRVQFPMAEDLLGALAIPVVGIEGWEGDDLLGTLARIGEDEGYDVLLITGDRDMYQLSSDHVKVVSTRKGMTDVQIMTPESVADLYNGVTPELVPDFYGLKGDSSDNIPGVPGIGPKKAAALIAEYGSLDAVIEHADEVKGKMGENLRAHVRDALVSREVAIIRTDAPVDIDLAESRFPRFDPAVVKDAFGALGFSALTRRVLALVGEGGSEVVAETRLELPEPLEGSAAFEAFERAAAEGQWLSAAMEANGEALTILDLERPRSELWVGCEAGLLHFEGDDATRLLLEALREHRVASCDVKSLVESVYPTDLTLDTELDIRDVAGDRIFDCGVAAYLIDSQIADYAPRSLVMRHLGLDCPRPSDVPSEAALAAWASAKLLPVLRRKLEESGSAPCFERIEMPLVGVLCSMERLGMRADAAVFDEEEAELKASIDGLVRSIRDRAGEDFSLDSPKQLSHVLFDVLGLPTAGLRKTQRGYYSTNAKALEELARDHQVVRDILSYRELEKIRSTYLLALPGLIKADGRIHTTFNQTVAATGRLSSSNPNLQNIPVRSELGRRVRQAFTVAEDEVFLACDYSQIELRLLAHLSGDEGLVAAFNSGADFHAATAARVFGVAVEDVTPALRSRAKAVNFGIVYGQQAFGLSQTLGIGRGEAQEMIDSYYAAYPGVRRYLDETVERARELGYAETMYGRRRPVPDIASRNFQQQAFAERTAMNHPMQGSAADIIKIAMVRVADELARGGYAAKLVLQIHDELDFEVPKAELDEVSELVKRTMEDVVELKVPLVADCSWGATWAEAK